jgi:ribonuclease P protein component
MGDQRLLAVYRIRRNADFRRVYHQRCAASDGLLRVLGCPNDLPYPRLGMAVSRKVGGAVVRNRWKRFIREAFRLRREQLPAGVDLVVVPHAGAEPDLAGLLESLPRLAQRVAVKALRSGRGPQP